VTKEGKQNSRTSINDSLRLNYRRKWTTHNTLTPVVETSPSNWQWQAGLRFLHLMNLITISC